MVTERHTVKHHPQIKTEQNHLKNVYFILQSKHKQTYDKVFNYFDSREQGG